MTPHERALSRMSPEELAVRRKLGEALLEFTAKIMEAGQPGEDGEMIE